MSKWDEKIKTIATIYEAQDTRSQTPNKIAHLQLERVQKLSIAAIIYIQ
jgi:hypothetical protein